MPSSAARPTGPAMAWLLAIRPKTLPAAASSVIVGSALTWLDGRFAAGPALAALGVALLLQIGSNLANDVYDHERGADTPDRLGPTRVTSSGLLTRSQVKRGMGVVFALALLLGVYLTVLRGPLVLLIGAVAIVSAIAYTGGPYPLGYHGLGELFVFLFFGVTAVVGTYWVQAGTTTPLVWLMSVPPGLMIVAIIVVNNLRDVEQDRLAQKRTVAVRIGVSATKIEYTACMVLPYVVVGAAAAGGMLPMPALACWLSLPLMWATVDRVFATTGRELNVALARTGQTALLFSLLFAGGLLLGG